MKISAKEIYNYLIDKGLSRNHALGMIANIKAESNFNVESEGDGGKSFGLFQHYDKRRDSLLKFINDNYDNKDWKTNWKGQIDFALQEEDGVKYINKSFNNPQEASEFFTMNFERPYSTIEKRKEEAKSRLSFFGEEFEVDKKLEFKDLDGKEITIKGVKYLINPRGQVNGKDVLFSKDDWDKYIMYGNQFKRGENYKKFAVPIERSGYTKEDFLNNVNDGTYSYDKTSKWNALKIKDVEVPVEVPEVEALDHEKYGYTLSEWTQLNPNQIEKIKAMHEIANELVPVDLKEEEDDPLPAAKTEEEIKEEEKEEEQEEEKELIEETEPLSSGTYIDDEGNLWRKGTEGGWQVKYNRATQEKGAPIGPKVDEFGQPIPGMQIEYDYQDDWTTFDKNDPLISNVQDFENQLTPFTGSLENLPSTTTTEEEAPLTNLEKAGRVGESLLKGAGAVLDAVGGPGAIISYIMGKKGLKEAMKEVKPQASAELSPMFMQHLRQTRELAKKGFHPDQAQKFRKELDGAYQKGLENAVRGSGGQRARFLAQSGVLDAQRSSALLDYAVKDEELQEKNKERYEKMMLFKENFDIQQTEKERAEDMARQVANKKAAAGFTSAAFTNLLSGFGRSSLIPNPAPGTTNLYDTIANWGKTEQTTQE